MGEEKTIRGGKNVALSVLAVVILCVLLFPVFWIVVTSQIGRAHV